MPMTDLDLSAKTLSVGMPPAHADTPILSYRVAAIVPALRHEPAQVVAPSARPKRA